MAKTASDTDVAAVETKVDTAITDIGSVDTVVDGIQSHLNNRTSSVDALIDIPFDVIENIFDKDMGYWTKVDAPGRVTIDYTNERIAIVDLDSDEDVYVYKATDANVTDFILDAEIEGLSTSIEGYFGVGLADGIGTMEDVANGLYVRLAWNSSNNWGFQIFHMTGGVLSVSTAISPLSEDTKYYIRLIRRGSYCWLGVYSDKSRETHVTGSPVEYRDVTPTAFTHFYPMCAYDDGLTGKALDAYVHSIKLISNFISNSTIVGIDTKVTKPEIIANIFDIDMGYWTEVDVGAGRVTIDYTNERIAIADLDNDEDVYVYKATDALVEDFILDFEFQVLNTTTAANSTCGIGLADGVGTLEDVNNGLYALIAWLGVNNTSVRIWHMTGGTSAFGDSIGNLNDDTTYYGRFIRRGSYCWLGIYSDRIRETHVTGSPVEYKDVTPTLFTHLYPMAGTDDGLVGKDLDAYVERIKLISAPDIDKYLGRHVA